MYDINCNKSNSKEQLIDESGQSRNVISGLWKPVTNAGIYKLQLNSKDMIYNNLYHSSTALTRTEKRTDSMDTAVEAAVRCVLNIVADNKGHGTQLKPLVFAKRRTFFQICVMFLDQFLFDKDITLWPV